MTKTIVKIEDITRKALNDSSRIFKCPNYTADVDTTEGQRVFYLTHYGTEILRYDLRAREILSFGGAYSVSDRDAINTALDYIGHDSKERAFIKHRELQLS